MPWRDGDTGRIHSELKIFPTKIQAGLSALELKDTHWQPPRAFLNPQMHPMLHSLLNCLSIQELKILPGKSQAGFSVLSKKIVA